MPRIAATLIAVLAVFTLAACGGRDAPALDRAALADELAANAEALAADGLGSRAVFEAALEAGALETLSDTARQAVDDAYAAMAGAQSGDRAVALAADAHATAQNLAARERARRYDLAREAVAAAREALAAEPSAP